MPEFCVRVIWLCCVPPSPSWCRWRQRGFAGLVGVGVHRQVVVPRGGVHGRRVRGHFRPPHGDGGGLGLGPPPECFGSRSPASLVPAGPPSPVSATSLSPSVASVPSVAAPPRLFHREGRSCPCGIAAAVGGMPCPHHRPIRSPATVADRTARVMLPSCRSLLASWGSCLAAP